MSVIFGIKENNRIIIAGDKRGSSIDGKTLSDDFCLLYTSPSPRDA